MPHVKKHSFAERSKDVDSKGVNDVRNNFSER